ncbi:hypothetical protein [Rhodococcus sp. NBC_00297]|uniref:hypothetical protein n=1 Tax=Rhodococcus sp. NBC_00297 TaxID=2976005 RepID=UPI002E2D115D|nr:hypothetical protein [Rhodococcus sp. NBC_00297]
MDWESWLRSAAKRPSDNEESKRDRTEQQIRAALNDYVPLSGKYRVYVKGSYANNTNVRLNYDVDVAVEYTGYFYSDLCFDLQGHDDSEVGVYASDDTYSREDFKRDIKAALINTFGSDAIEIGKIAYRVREDKTTLPADVVPSWEYRRFDRINAWGDPVVHVGSRVYPSDGGYKNNFPKIQVIRGTEKNERTHRRYKRMVRCLKKMQTRLMDAGVLENELPSYLVECLVYNVPDSLFNNSTYLEDFRKVVCTIWGSTQPNGDWDEWEEAHGLHYLFKGSFAGMRADAHTLADKAWDEVGIE